MQRLRSSLLIALLLAFCSVKPSTQAQQPTANSNELVAKLLEHSAPLPPSAFDYLDPWAPTVKSPPPVPSDDAPIEMLIKYWRFKYRGEHDSNPNKPNHKVRQRMLEAAENDPDELPSLLNLLPDTPEAHDRVKALFDQRVPVDAKSKDHLEKDWQESVRNWLMLRSRYFREDLLAQLNQLTQLPDANLENTGMVGSYFLSALAKLDWEAAKPMLERMSESSTSNRAALALSVDYKHTLDAKDQSREALLRERLKQMAQNPKASSFARTLLLDALLRADWPGRDDWFISVLGDETLRSSKAEKTYTFAGIAFAIDRERYVPLLVRSVGHPNRLLHDEAVSFLLNSVNYTEPRRELLLPLLPWLDDPQWASGTEYQRGQLIQLAGRAKLNEAVPALLAILEREPQAQGISAVMALEHLHAPQAGPVLRKAAAQVPSWALNVYATTLVKCGALTEVERLAYLEKYATHVERVNADGGLSYSLVGGDFDSLEWSLGARLSDGNTAPLHLASVLLERVKSLEKENPKLARNLWLVIQRWPSPLIWQRLVERLADGTADDLTVRQLLFQREQLRARAGLQLRSLSQDKGLAAGVAAVVLGEKALQQSILDGEDRATQSALLACARLVREPLSLEAVNDLAQVGNQQLRLAVDRYLETVDTAEARALVLARHPKQGLILGGRMSFDPRRNYWLNWEEKLRQEVVRSGGPTEILALGIGGSRDLSQQAVLRFYPGRATLTKQKDASREEMRELMRDEIDEIRVLFAELEQEPLPPPIIVQGGDGHSIEIQTEFLRVRPAGGQRVFTNTVFPGRKGKSPYQRLYNRLEEMMKAEGFKLRYYLADPIPGLEVLYADERPRAANVCLQGDDLKVLVEEKLELSSTEWSERYSQGLGDIERSWRRLREGKFTATVEEPNACPIMADELAWLARFHGPDDVYSPAWQAKLGKDAIRAGYQRLERYKSSEQGLWRLHPGQSGEQIALGEYLRPLVTHDGRWIIVTKRHLPEGKKDSVESIVRIDTKTYRESATSMRENKERVRPVTEIRELKKVLVCQPASYSRNPEWKNCRLLDPITGNSS
jgi:hypothetical protein